MEKGEKYRLGNQSKEYELITQYLGWLPKGFSDWNDWIWAEEEKRLGFELCELLRKKTPRPLTIFSPDGKESVTLLMDHFLIKDEFPLYFFGEERAKNWWLFFKVSTKENPDEEFVIPLH